ncbi:MAG: sensor histidine kinase [Umezawaea sp.]
MAAPPHPPDRLRDWTQHLLHAAFLLILVGTAARFVELNTPRCWVIMSLSVLLTAGYLAGMGLWERIRGGVWFGVLFVLWMALLAVVPPELTSTFAWCGVPLVCLAARVLDRTRALAVLATVTVLLLGLGAWRTVGFQPDVVVAPVAAIWAAAGLYRLQQRDAEALRAARHEADVLAERARIARDIHDTLAQDIAGSRMLLQAADRDRARNPETAWARVRAVTESLGANLTETRRIIADLLPRALDGQDLTTALTDLCDQVRRSGVTTAFRVVGDVEPVPSDTAITVLRVAQGALGNVRDHAEARSVWVTLERAGDWLTLTVRDDGIGFDPDHLVTSPGRGFGLVAIRERVDECGGTFTVRSSPGAGTVLTATVGVALVTT